MEVNDICLDSPGDGDSVQNRSKTPSPIYHPFIISRMQDGFRTPLHEFEDRYIRVVLDQDTYLYGVFDGHEGSLASDFASQRMPAEILLGQLQGKTEDDDVKAVLHQVTIEI